MQTENQKEMSLVEIIYDIVSNKNDIAYLKNSVSCGSFQTKNGYISQENSTGIKFLDNSSWIRLVRLNKTFIARYISWHYEWRRNNYNENPNQDFLTMFNNKYRENGRGFFYIGANIDFDLKIEGYHYNANNIYDSYYVETNKIDTNLNKLNVYIYKFLFIGEKNFLIGFIDKYGILYLDQVILEKLRRAVSYDKFKEIVIRLISVFANANSLFFRSNIMGVDGELTERIGKFLVARLNNLSQECTIIEPQHIDLFNDCDEVSVLLSKIKELISTQIKRYIEDTRWGINNQYSYKQLLDSYLAKKYETQQKDIDAAFSSGLLYGNKFELSGWIVSDQKFDGCIAWEKEVHIIPMKVNYKGKIRNIDPNWKGNPYHIDKIFITTDGKMYCEGYHPNTNNGNVCMGDISGKISLTDVRKLGENLNRCEALLNLINFDSAYDSSNLEEVLAHSTIDVSSNFEIDKEYIGDNETLTDVSFEDEEDSTTKNIDPDEDTETHVEIIND